MKEYIERKSLCEELEQMAKFQEPYKRNTILGVVSTIKSRKTADVAPRSEVAKEIFEEIGKLLAVDKNGKADLSITELYILEMKYTD